MTAHSARESNAMTARHLVLRRICAAALGVLLATPAWADYAPQRGDVLEIAVSGAPVLNRRLTVNTDGRIVYSVLGEVPVEGQTLSALKTRLEAMLAARNVVQHPDVLVSVAEYGPIYVSGDVLRPGELRYRPEMTVGTAIALAGGFDLSQSEPRVTAPQLSEARAQFGEAMIELTRQQVRIARLKAELAGSDKVEPEPGEAGADPAVLAQIIGIETAQLIADRGADERERTHLGQMVAAARGELAALEAAEQQQQRTYDQQLQSSTRARDLMGRGVGTMLRTEDSERAAGLAQAQLLEARVRAAQARKELQERTRNLETFDDHRRTLLLQALTDSVAEAAKVRYRIESARERLSGLGGERIRQSDVVARATIRRVVDGVPTVLPATAATRLQSGDAVEVVAGDATPRRPAARE
jgi:polysaccharide export outer membrane protein